MSVRGRKNKEFSLICKHFCQKDQKPFSPAKFADDKSRAFANSILEMDLDFLPFELKERLRSLNNKKTKFNKKAVMVIEEISLFPGAWLLIKNEFLNLSSWMNRIEVKLKIIFNDADDEKNRIYVDLVRLIFEYLENKGKNAKKKKCVDSTYSNTFDDSESDKFSDTCSTTNSVPPLSHDLDDLFESSSTFNISDCINIESFEHDLRSGDELDLDDLSMSEDLESERKQPEG
jgi:hypothetical protein